MRAVRTAVPVIVLVAGLVGACGGPPADMPPGTVPEVTVMPSGVQIPAVVPEAVTESCNPRASLRPLGPPGVIPPGSTMARIRDRKRLIVGVGPSAYRLSYRDPHDEGTVKGFEADIATEIAFAIFGDRDPSRIQFRALNTADRIPAVRGVTDDGKPVDTVDMVLAAMTMTCERWEKVAFSAEYYSAGQAVLVPKASDVKGIEDLGGKKVCASATSTNIRAIDQRDPRPVPVAAANTSDCLLLLQQGQVDAVSTGDVILAGLAAQDPSMEIRGSRFTDEPTGIAMNKQSADLVRFVNAVLEELTRSGRWKTMQEDWLAEWLPTQIQQAVVPPVPQYQPE